MQHSRTVSRVQPPLALLFTVTIFLSALLLFFVQPLYTRMVLPQIGGAAAVWTTAMLFFQAVLSWDMSTPILAAAIWPPARNWGFISGFLFCRWSFFRWLYRRAGHMIRQTR